VHSVAYTTLAKNEDPAYLTMYTGSHTLSLRRVCTRLTRKPPPHSPCRKDFPDNTGTSKVCRQGKGSSRGGVRNGEALICLQEQIRASRGLPVSGGSQVDGSIGIMKPSCQVFFQVSGHRRRSWWGKEMERPGAVA